MDNSSVSTSKVKETKQICSIGWMDMKRKGIVVSTIVLIVLIVGVSSAWFLDSETKVNEFKMGTVEVEVLEPGFKDITGAEEETYEKKVNVISKGTKSTYVRVRLIPEWSEPSLPVSNVVLNLAQNSDWVDGGDGYYYFKYYLTQGQETSPLLESVTFTTLGPEYSDKTLTIKAVAEGVQITHEAWKDVWAIKSLPFEPEQPWNHN